MTILFVFIIRLYHCTNANILFIFIISAELMAKKSQLKSSPRRRRRNRSALSMQKFNRHHAQIRYPQIQSPRNRLYCRPHLLFLKRCRAREIVPRRLFQISWRILLDFVGRAAFAEIKTGFHHHVAKFAPSVTKPWRECMSPMPKVVTGRNDCGFREHQNRRQSLRRQASERWSLNLQNRLDLNRRAGRENKQFQIPNSKTFMLQNGRPPLRPDIGCRNKSDCRRHRAARQAGKIANTTTYRRLQVSRVIVLFRAAIT